MRTFFQYSAFFKHENIPPSKALEFLKEVKEKILSKRMEVCERETKKEGSKCDELKNIKENNQKSLKKGFFEGFNHITTSLLFNLIIPN